MVKNNDLDVEQKFAKVIVDLRALRPFYSAVYEALERIETESVDTMGVTTTKMLYNNKFVDSITYPEFLFVNLHEICHVALMHVSRRGNRDPQLWNIACDLYVNKLLAEEFNLTPGGYDSSNTICMPTMGCWCSSIDINTECAESIYEVFDKQAKENGYYKAMYGDGSDNAQGSGGSSEENSDSNENSNQESKKNKFSFNYTGTKKDEDNWRYRYNNTSSNGDGKTFNMNISVIHRGDIIDTGEDDMKKENDNKRILSEAKTRYDMSKMAGRGTGLLQIKVENILKSHIDWRKWLKKYCIKARANDSTFSNPDKRMFYQNAIYPGQAVDENNTIKDIKICIDTSGSISDEDLEYIFGQIHSLSKQYKIEAEVIAWDCGMTSCGNLNSGTDIRKIQLQGGGGTDPTCVFEYFDSKKCKRKPAVILMFTDGYWNMNENSKWARKYRDTLWVLTRDADDKFKPPFGLVTEVKYGK